MKKSRTVAGATLACTALVLGGVTALADTAGAATSPTTAVANTLPGWTARAQHLGHAAASAPVDARVYLAPQGGMSALTAAATAVSTPGDAAYGHFLTAAQYRARFGIRASTVRAVSSYLRSSGLHITSVGAGNRYVAVRGDVAAAQRAFGTRIERYRHGAVNVQAPARALHVPSALGSAVLTIAGIDTTVHKMVPASTPATTPAKAPAGFRVGTPCSAYYGQKLATAKADGTPLPTFQGTTLPYNPCGYTGTQLRTAYEGATTLDGSGVTVAITDAYNAPTIRGDANTYAVKHGDKAFGPGQFVQSKPPTITDRDTCTGSGWYGEETLDVEAVHAMAPGANVHYYGSRNCYDDGFLETLARIDDEDSVQLVTNSWGDPEDSTGAEYGAPFSAVFAQGALEGISFLYSSGDDGDSLASTGAITADFPTSDPYVTSVGGTTTAIGKTGTLEWSTGWGTKKWSLSADSTSWSPLGFVYGGGGGVSKIFAKPFYQRGIVGGPAKRQVPDMAMDADPTTGMLVGETQIFPNGKYYDEYRIGGTSLASPLFAGMTALTLQHAGHAFGLLNPQIYRNRSAFTDIRGKSPDVGNVRADNANGVDASDGTVYSVRTFNQDSSLRVRPGWDDVTGVGVPTTAWLTALK